MEGYLVIYWDIPTCWDACGTLGPSVLTPGGYGPRHFAATSKESVSVGLLLYSIIVMFEGLGYVGIYSTSCSSFLFYVQWFWDMYDGCHVLIHHTTVTPAFFQDLSSCTLGASASSAWVFACRWVMVSSKHGLRVWAGVEGPWECGECGASHHRKWKGRENPKVSSWKEVENWWDSVDSIITIKRSRNAKIC